MRHLLSEQTLFGVKSSSDDVFYDLGSGFGKLALQAFLEGGTGSSFGIEINQVRHLAAVDALNILADLLGTKIVAVDEKAVQLMYNGSQIEVRHGDEICIDKCTH